MELYFFHNFCNVLLRFSLFLACDVFVRMNRHVIAMMFVHLSGTGVHCDHTMHVSTDSSLWLDSAMFWAQCNEHVHLLPVVFFHFHLEERWGMDVQTIGVISQERLKIGVKLLLSADGK